MRPLLLAAALALASPVFADPLPLDFIPIDRFTAGSPAERFGALEFRGGLEIRSPDWRFGGLSGIDLASDGATAFFVSDDGFFVRATLDYAAGRLAGIREAHIYELFDEPLSKHETDAEDLALDPTDPERGLIVFERRDTPVLAFRLRDGRPRDYEELPVREDVLQLAYNRGLESVAFAPAGAAFAGQAVVIAERARDRAAGTIPGWVLGGGRFEIVRREGYDISSARFLPDGDLLLLERRFSPGWGIGMRLRRIAAASIAEGAILDGEVLLEAGMRSQIDNMEGLAVHRGSGGEIILTIVSDDNRSVLQRTLLLQFALAAI